MPQQFNLPPIHVKPDHSYFDGQVESYDFVSGGKEATLGFIKAGFEGVFPADEGGEEITLLSPLQKRGELAIDVLDDDGNIEASHRLINEGDSVSILGGKQMRVATTKAVVEYVCEYPGRPVKVTPETMA
jgi:uncharacterized protein YaiE (UPF0345 family)